MTMLPCAVAAGVREAPRHEIAGSGAPRCRGRYGDLAAGSGLRRLDRNGRDDRLASKHVCTWRGERVECTERGKIDGARAGQSNGPPRAWALLAERQQE